MLNRKAIVWHEGTPSCYYVFLHGFWKCYAINHIAWSWHNNFQHQHSQTRWHPNTVSESSVTQSFVAIRPITGSCLETWLSKATLTNVFEATYHKLSSNQCPCTQYLLVGNISVRETWVDILPDPSNNQPSPERPLDMASQTTAWLPPNKWTKLFSARMNNVKLRWEARKKRTLGKRLGTRRRDSPLWCVGMSSSSVEVFYCKCKNVSMWHSQDHWQIYQGLRRTLSEPSHYKPYPHNIRRQNIMQDTWAQYILEQNWW